MGPPQLSFGFPIDLSADVPIFPPAATLLTVITGIVAARLFGRVRLAPLVPAGIRVAALAIGAGAAYSLVTQAGSELKFAGSGTLFTPVGGLATGGLYQYTRNPMYAGLVFVVLPASAVLQNSAWPVLLAPLLWAYLNFVVIAAEEALLSAEFGAEYSRFAARVPRWLI